MTNPIPPLLLLYLLTNTITEDEADQLTASLAHLPVTNHWRELRAQLDHELDQIRAT